MAKNCGLDDSAIRKMQPVGAILRDYFPDAFRAVAAVAWVGNEKHNPGQPLHWARGKSDDHFEAEIRHALDGKGWDTIALNDGRKYAVLHAAEKAWRALAELQLIVEEQGGEVIQVINHWPTGTATLTIGSSGAGGGDVRNASQEKS